MIRTNKRLLGVSVYAGLLTAGICVMLSGCGKDMKHSSGETGEDKTAISADGIDDTDDVREMDAGMKDDHKTDVIKGFEGKDVDGRNAVMVAGTGFSAEYNPERITCYQDVGGVDGETHFFYNNVDPNVVVGVSVRKEDGVSYTEYAQRIYDANFGTDQSIGDVKFGRGEKAVKATYYEDYGNNKTRVEIYAVEAAGGCLIVEVDSSYAAGVEPVLGGDLESFLGSFVVE